jgi:hypothetical protein
MSIIIPADHVGKSVIAVLLGVALVMSEKEIPVRECDGPEVCGAQHLLASTSKSMGTCPGMGANPSDL